MSHTERQQMNPAPSAPPQTATDGPGSRQEARGETGPQADGVEAVDGLREAIAAAVESEVYEYRERTMLWEETGGVTEEIARLATRGAMEAIERHLDIGEEQAWCKTCRRVWEGRSHRCEADPRVTVYGIDVSEWDRMWSVVARIERAVTGWTAEDHAGHGSPCEEQSDGVCSHAAARARTTPDNPATSSEGADNSALREAIAAAILTVPIKYGVGPDAYTIHPVSPDEAAAIAAAVLAVRDAQVEQLRAKVAEIDHIINWHTTCASCARILDSSYRETMRAEQAEDALTRVRALAERWENAVAPDHAYARALRAALDQPQPPAPDGDPDTRCGDPYRTKHHGVARCSRGLGHPGIHAGHADDGTTCQWPPPAHDGGRWFDGEKGGEQ